MRGGGTAWKKIDAYKHLTLPKKSCCDVMLERLMPRSPSAGLLVQVAKLPIRSAAAPKAQGQPLAEFEPAARTAHKTHPSRATPKFHCEPQRARVGGISMLRILPCFAHPMLKVPCRRLPVAPAPCRSRSRPRPPQFLTRL